MGFNSFDEPLRGRFGPKWLTAALARFHELEICKIVSWYRIANHKSTKCYQNSYLVMEAHRKRSFGHTFFRKRIAAILWGKRRDSQMGIARESRVLWARTAILCWYAATVSESCCVYEGFLHFQLYLHTNYTQMAFHFVAVVRFPYGKRFGAIPIWEA